MSFYYDRPTNGFMSVMVAILYTLTIYFLENLDSTIIFNPTVRRILSDYAYPVSATPSPINFTTHRSRYVDWHPLLGRLLAHTGTHKANTHRVSTSHSSILSYCQPWLVDRFLESTGEMDLRGSSYWNACHLAILLRPCTWRPHGCGHSSIG